MNELTWGVVIAGLGLVCSLCTIAAFYIGRRKAAADEGKEKGSLKKDIEYIKDTVKDTTKSLETLAIKLEAQDKQREDDYRQLLVQLTELKSSYKSLHLRVDHAEQQISQYHHHS